MERNADIYGAAVAFEPDVPGKGKGHFAPYFYRSPKKLEFVDLAGPSYNYLSKDWYQISKELGKPQWSEPYYDEGGGGILMSTDSVPFYRTKGGERYLAGVVTADISLEWLKEVVSSIKVLQTGFAILTSRKGTIITHPSGKRVMNETIFSLAEKRGYKRFHEIGRSMIRGECGLVPVATVAGKESWICYAPIPSSGWTLSYVRLRDLSWEFPSKRFLDALRAIGARHVVLHRKGYGPFQWARLQKGMPQALASGSLREAATLGTDTVYEVGPAR